MTLVELPNQPLITDTRKRHVATGLFDVWMGTPNGDPDRDNLPRQLSDGHGYVTDGALKRKVRDCWSFLLAEQDHYLIYMQHSTRAGALNARTREANEQVIGVRAEALSDETSAKTSAKALVGSKSKKSTNGEDVKARRQYMLEHYLDTRLFGAVMSTGDFPAGQVQGPVQITAARSIHPIEIETYTLTRVAVTREDEVDAGKMSEMGSKSFIPYALYQYHLFYNTPLAAGTGVTSRDLELLWIALQSIWELDRSAAKGMLSFRGLVIWSQDSPYGNVHAQNLLEDRVQVKLKEGIVSPRQFKDYTITIDTSALPAGVTCTPIGI